MTLIWCQDQVRRDPLQPKSNPHLTPWKNGMNMENLLRACHQPLPVPLNEHGSLKLYIIHHASMRQMPVENPINLWKPWSGLYGRRSLLSRQCVLRAQSWVYSVNSCASQSEALLFLPSAPTQTALFYCLLYGLLISLAEHHLHTPDPLLYTLYNVGSRSGSCSLPCISFCSRARGTRRVFRRPRSCTWSWGWTPS